MVSNLKNVLFNINKPEKLINENGNVKYNYTKKTEK